MESQGYWGRRFSRRRALVGAATGGLGVAGLAIAGCGGSDSSPAEVPTPPAAKQEEIKSMFWPRTDTSARAVKGSTYQGYTLADVTNLDPLSSPSYTANVAGSWTYPRLLKYKPGYRVPATGEIEGYLATGWEQPEPTVMILKLRPDAVWEERLKRRPIDAEDVVFSWKKFAAKGAVRKDIVKLPDNPGAPVVSIDAVDRLTVQVKLAYPYAPLPSALAYGRYMQVMPRESDGGYDPRNESRSGGPWILDNYQRNVIFQYRKNPDWWDADKVFFDGYDFPIIGEYAAGLAQFRAKKLWSFGVRQDDIISTKNDMPELALDQGAFARTCWGTHFGIQPDSPFRDFRVRQAVSMVIDRDAWIDTFYNISAFRKAGWPTEVRYHSHISSGWEGLWVDPKSADMGPGARSFTYDVAEARKLMSAAGYPNGIDTEIRWVAGPLFGTDFDRQCGILKAMFEESGLFRLKELHPDYQTEYAAKIHFGKGDFKGIAIDPTSIYPEVDQFIFALYHSQGSYQQVSLFGKEPDAKNEQLIEAQRRELDPKKRADLIKEWQRYQAVQMMMVPWPGQSPGFSLFWPWIGNAGVNRSWDAESNRESVETRLWFDRSKYSG
jgi:peptide/nickel transport system substrate-binding protein